MKRLSFAVFAILAGLLGLVQSFDLPTSKSTNKPSSNSVSIVHPSHSHTHASKTTRDHRWHPEHTSAENTHVGHPRGEGKANDVPIYPYGFQPSMRLSGSKLLATSVHHTGYVISTYQPQLIGSASRKYCNDGLCLEERDYDHHPTQTPSWTPSEHTGATEQIIQTSHTTSTQQTEHLSRSEHVHTTRLLSGTRFSSHLTITDGTHPTTEPNMIHARTDNRNNIRLCSKTCPHGQICSFVSGFDFPQCLPVGTSAFDIRAENRTIEFLTCPTNVAHTCPSGRHCTLIQGFDINFVVCLPDKNTNTVNPRAEATGGSVPEHCTEETIFLEPTGNHDINITYPGCVAPLKPQFDTYGNCLCELPANAYVGSPDVTETTGLPPRAEMTGDASLVHFTGSCRVEQQIDLPDQWDNGDLIHNHTRYICMTGSQPLFLRNGTCDCIKRYTMLPTGHGRLGENTKATFNSLYSNGHGSSANTTALMTYKLERSSLHSTITRTRSILEATTTQDSPLTSKVRFDLASTAASTSVYIGSFPFDPNATVMQTVTMDSLLSKDPSLFPTGIDIGPTYVSKINKRQTATPTGQSCPQGFQSITTDYPHPSRYDCPITLQVKSLQRWGSMTIAYSSLDDFCRDLQAIVYLPWGIDVQSTLKTFCQGNGLTKRVESPPLPTDNSNRFPTINATHPKPSSADEAINIEIYIGEEVNKGVETSPHYVTVFYADGLDAFCDFLKHGSDQYVYDRLPKGASQKQVEAEYCKDNIHHPKRGSAPTKTTTATYSYETINYASPIPTNDKNPICIEILTGEKSVGLNQQRPTYDTRCYVRGLKDFCHWTLLWHANYETSNWDGPGDIEEILHEYCSQYN